MSNTTEQIRTGFVPFNLNETILVKLTDLGCQHLADRHNSYIGRIPRWEARDAEYYKKNADSEGYKSFQGWRFIEEFGPVTSIGMQQHYHLDILVRSDAASQISSLTAEVEMARNDFKEKQKELEVALSTNVYLNEEVERLKGELQWRMEHEEGIDFKKWMRENGWHWHQNGYYYQSFDNNEWPIPPSRVKEKHEMRKIYLSALKKNKEGGV